MSKYEVWSCKHLRLYIAIQSFFHTLFFTSWLLDTAGPNVAWLVLVVSIVSKVTRQEPRELFHEDLTGGGSQPSKKLIFFNAPSDLQTVWSLLLLGVSPNAITSPYVQEKDIQAYFQIEKSLRRRAVRWTSYPDKDLKT